MEHLIVIQQGGEVIGHTQDISDNFWTFCDQEHQCQWNIFIIKCLVNTSRECLAAKKIYIFHSVQGMRRTRYHILEKTMN